MNGLLVTGTDTGVGKTEVAVRLARSLVTAGLSLGVMKPCETGIAPDPDHALPPGSDAARLAEAAASDDPPERVRPYVFELPAAPTAAAEAEGRTLSLARLDEAWEALRARHDAVLVEGAGGLLVPLTAQVDFADLAARWDLPLLIVARAGLGTLNHTALTVRVARSRGLRVLGVVVNQVDGPISDPDRANLADLAGLVAPTPVLAELPHGAEADEATWEAVVAAVRAALAAPTGA